jgi:hypothetical protein
VSSDNRGSGAELGVGMLGEVAVATISSHRKRSWADRL